MNSISMASASQDRAETHFRHGPPHIAVQILGLLLFGGFAIVATILAMVTFWPAGVALAMVLAWIGFGPILNQHHPRPGLDWVKQVVPQNQVNRTGNTSFDAYRAEVLDRLEDEQKTFVSFLDRLRDAKDKAQFDSFTDDRARANRDAEAEDEDKRNDARRGEY